MGTIGIVDAEQAEWTTSHSSEPSPDPGREIDYEVRMLVHQVGDETLPRMHEIDHPPNRAVVPHAHDCDEIIYVVAGEMVLGSRTLAAGSSVFIPANTLYSFRSGPNGLRFVNFRPHGNVRSILKDEFMRERSTRAEPTERV